jgi:hypothetical protein
VWPHVRDVQLVNQVTRAADVEHDRCGRDEEIDRLIDPGALSGVE